MDKPIVNETMFFLGNGFNTSITVCLMETKCPNKTIGTINVGSQLNGKFKIAMFGCFKCEFLYRRRRGEKAFTTTLIRRPRHIKFRTKIVFLLIFPLLNPKYATIGPVTPAIMSTYFVLRKSLVQERLCSEKANTV